MTFKEKLVNLRKIKGITQDEFAKAIGVSRQAVYKWESGQSYPEVTKLLEIKLLFGISIDDLLDESYEVKLPEKKRRRNKDTVKVSLTPPTAEDQDVLVTETEGIKEDSDAMANAVSTSAIEDASVSISKKPSENESKTEKSESTHTEQKAEKAEKEEKKVGFFGRLFGRR